MEALSEIIEDTKIWLDYWVMVFTVSMNNRAEARTLKKIIERNSLHLGNSIERDEWHETTCAAPVAEMIKKYYDLLRMVYIIEGNPFGANEVGFCRWIYKRRYNLKGWE